MRNYLIISMVLHGVVLYSVGSLLVKEPVIEGLSEEPITVELVSLAGSASRKAGKRVSQPEKRRQSLPQKVAIPKKPPATVAVKPEAVPKRVDRAPPPVQPDNDKNESTTPATAQRIDKTAGQGLSSVSGQVYEPSKGGAPSDGLAGHRVRHFKRLIFERIEAHRFYPLAARRRGYEGVVRVAFRVLRDGSVEGVRVVSPCRCEILNRAACKIVQSAAPFPAPPQDWPADGMQMEIGINFSLN